MLHCSREHLFSIADREATKRGEETPSAEDEFLTRETLRLIGQEIANLPPSYKASLIGFSNGRNVAEMARQRRETPSEIRKQIIYGVRSVRSHVGLI